MSARPTHASAIYEGSLRHRRFLPRSHIFSYRQCMFYLDLDELPALDHRGLFSAKRAAPLRFDSSDYLDSDCTDLATGVRDLVSARLGRRPDGPVRLLTQVRWFGFVFNPISIYYCFDSDEKLSALVAEVSNTPWGERRCYVIDCAGQPRRQQARFDKHMHVSPFNPVDMVYHWHSRAPGARVLIHLENWRDATRIMDATLSLQRREWSSRNLLRVFWRHPGMAVTAVVRIYWQALRLWLKRVPLHAHPRNGKHRAA